MYATQSNRVVHVAYIPLKSPFSLPAIKAEKNLLSKLSYEEKNHIIRNGRPTPEIRELKQQKGTKIIRTFQTNWYSRKEWLCGCAAKVPMYAVFCI